MLKRSITTLELIQLNKFFSAGRGYKDLIRDIEKQFKIKMTKQEARHFLETRSWSELLKWLTGEDIDTGDLDKIPEIKREHFELLDVMLKLSSSDKQEWDEELEAFKKETYYIPSDVKYFNMPLYGEIITYKYKEPFLKCFLLNDKHKIEKIEDVPVSNDLPHFLLTIIQVINHSFLEFKGKREDLFKTELLQQPLSAYVTSEDIETHHMKNIFESDLFKKYNIQFKV